MAEQEQTTTTERPSSGDTGRRFLAPWNMDSAQAYYAYALLRTPPSSKKVAYWVTGIFILLFSMLFLPWQQNIQGQGEVTALSPDQRPQLVPSALDGQLVEWYVQEGQYVEQGDSLARIIEIKDKYFDPELLVRLQDQIDAKQGAISATRQKTVALRMQYQALEEARKFKLSQARNKVEQNRYKVRSDSVNLVAAQTNLRIAQQQYDRMLSLFQQDLKSKTDLEKREMKLQQAQAKQIEAINKLAASRQELTNSIIDLNGISADYSDKLAKSLSERSSAEAYLQDAQSKLAKMRNEYSNMAIRRSFHVIRAPQSGYVVQAIKTGVGENVKAGDPIVTIMPDKPQLAVALYVRDTDVPLLSPGRKVRLQFDGWPTLQVTGWPSVSVGTFGGEIAVVDYVNTQQDYYRVLVRPDPNEEPWPDQLRIGSGVYGWAMLDEVPLWFELWRQLNGFPPSLQQQPGTRADGSEVESAAGGKKGDKKPGGKMPKGSAK